ncbi:MAG: PKD-like domain-containing protein, partial [Saprospiraceae bacterium]
MDQPQNVVVCGGSIVQAPFTGLPAGLDFSWFNDNPNIGLGTSGVGSISFTSINPTATEVANISVTPQTGSCPGVLHTFTITVNPAPTVDEPASQTLCGGEPISVIFSGASSGGYSWLNDNPAIGLPASGSGDIAAVAANVTTTQTAQLSVVATGVCPSPPQNFTIIVNPVSTVNAPADRVVCGGLPVNVPLSGLPAGTLFTWTNDNPAIGLGASGTGNINFISAVLSSQEMATITVSPLGPCPGPAVTFTITVKPVPSVVQPANLSVCSGAPISVDFGSSPGITYGWTNSNPAIGLPASGSGNISIVAANLSTIQTGNITVIPTENGCPGLPQNFTITVNPIPTVNQPSNITVCSGDAVNIPLTGTPVGTAFNWVNDNPAIGLGASGTGNISFASAVISAPETATITVTPGNGDCTVTSKTFTITVLPLPALDQPSSQTICAGDPITVSFSGSSPTATYNWTNSNPAIGLPNSGTGDIAVLSANVASTQTANIIVTPIEGANCPGETQNFTITVLPAPTLNQPANVTACGGAVVNIPFTVLPPGTVTDWTNDNPNIGLTSSGSGNIMFTSINVTATEVATITVTPSNGGICTGPVRTFAITINPVVTLTVTGFSCDASSMTYSIDLLSTANSITASAGTISGGSGSYTISNIPQGVNVTVQALSPSCPLTQTITAPDCNCPLVNPPVVSNDQVICENEPIPDLTVTVGADETADWYSAATGGALLEAGTLSFT